MGSYSDYKAVGEALFEFVAGRLTADGSPFAEVGFGRLSEGVPAICFETGAEAEVEEDIAGNAEIMLPFILTCRARFGHGEREYSGAPLMYACELLTQSERTELDGVVLDGIDFTAFPERVEQNVPAGYELYQAELTASLCRGAS